MVMSRISLETLIVIVRDVRSHALQLVVVGIRAIDQILGLITISLGTEALPTEAITGITDPQGLPVIRYD